MRCAPLLQRSSWQFDLRSALVGAAAAWIIAFIVYQNREALKQLAQKLWEPISQWRRKLQSSTEEKYLSALQETLQGLLLFTPRDPRITFAAPSYLAPSPIPTSITDETQLGNPYPVVFDHIVDGHTKLLITGEAGSGRTYTLLMLAYKMAEAAEGTKEQQPYQRFPLWIDLSLLTPERTEAPPTLESLAELGVAFFAQAYPKWIVSQLQDHPSLILLDNWDVVPLERRKAVAQWIEGIISLLPESIWVAATSPEGYGPLTELRFVPLAIVPPKGEEAINKILDGWASLLNQEETEEKEVARHSLRWAVEAGASLAEITLRTLLYLRTGELPNRQIEVMEALLDLHLPLPNIGEEQAEVAQAARQIALTVLTEAARSLRLENQGLSKQAVQDLVLSLLPPEEERSPKLESEARKLLQNTAIARYEGNTLRFSHDTWEDYFAARALAQEPEFPTLLTEHLHDPSWIMLLEYYVGMGNATPLVKALLQESITPTGHTSLLRVARWAIIAPEEAAWRKVVLKALAQIFTKPSLSPDERLQVGRAIALVAGESAKPFYLQSLRSPEAAIQAAAIRGLGWTGTVQDMKVMAAALNDKHFEIQESAVHALADIGTAGAYRFLSDSLYRSNEQLMLIIAETLAHTSDGWEALKEAVKAPDLLVRRAAVHGLGHIHQPWAIEILQHLVREDDQWLVRSAAEAALSTQTEKEDPAVVTPPPKIDETQWLISWAAKQGLGVGVGEAALPMLLRALEVGEAEIQVLAIQTLIQIGKQEHLEILRPLLNNEDPRVQQATKTAIQVIETRYRGIA